LLRVEASCNGEPLKRELEGGSHLPKIPSVHGGEDVKKRNSDPQVFRDLLARSGIHQALAARLIGVSERSLRRWYLEEGAPEYALRYFRLLWALELEPEMVFRLLRKARDYQASVKSALAAKTGVAVSFPPET